MTSEQADQLDREDRHAAALASCLEALDSGPSVDRAVLLARYPEFATELDRFLQDQEHVECCAAPLRAVAGIVPAIGLGGYVCPHKELGGFRIVREVGRGGMGVVYEAEQLSLRRRVALKVLPFAATMDPRHLQRFHNEAQAAACLHHTNIVPVFFVGSERGVHFYAMQFIDGQPLSEIVRQLRQMDKKAPETSEQQTAAYQPSAVDSASTPPVAAITPLSGEGRRSRDYFRKVAELGVQAAVALDYAHQLGIVHRDIKPANLLLDGRGILWVTDFGLAYVQHGEASLTGTGQMVGTPRYMSPEQPLAKRVPIDHRTDVYALGVTLYELLTLRPAFESEDREELLRQIAFEEPAKPRRMERTVPAELEIIVLKAMEKRPQDRYATAQELADDLGRWLKHEPIRARRPTLLQRGAKWMRRHKQVTGTSAIVLLMALLLAGYITWTHHARKVRQEIIENSIRAALKDSRDRLEERRLQEALSAARRAVGLLAGADVDEALRQEVQSRRDDLVLLEKLENVRLEYASVVKDGHFDRGATDRLYEQLFRKFGLDLEAQTAEESAERIRRSTVAVDLAAMLGEWAVSRGRAKGIDDPSRKTLLRIARLADPDPWRTRVREALETKDRQALQTLSATDAVFDLPPVTLHLLGSALASDKEICGQAEAFLRRAQQRYPQDFWLADILFPFYWNTIQPRQREEAIGFALVAVSLRPNSPGVHNDLGLALMHKNRLEEAIGEFQEAIRLKNDYAGAHSNLGVALMRKGRLDKAINKFKEAIRINTDDPEYHANLADALNDKHQWDQAITESHEAIRLNKEFSGGHYELARALSGKGLWDEALAECRKAIQLNKNDLSAYNGLGSILCDGKHDYDGAITAFREVIRRDKNNADAHHNLGIALSHKGQWDQAASAFREAVQLKTDDARWHSELGKTLVQTGQYLPALEVLRRGRELAANNHRQYQLFSQQVQECENLLELDGKLAAVLSRQKQPADAEERLTLAWMCQRHRQWHAASVRFYREAFAEKPQWASDLRTQHGYNAACSAALAGCGKGKDADKVDANERAGLRRQAHDWLRADLKAYRQSLEKSAGKAGPAIAQRMQHWLQVGDFAGVRGDEALAKLPAEERSAWRKLWADVAELLAKIQGTAPAEKKPETKEQPRDHTGA